MPLSEHEQRQLEQIEQALYREDPKFGRLVRSSDPRVHYKRRLVQAVLGVLIGAGLIAAGIVTRRLYLEAAGGVIAALCLLWSIVNWRQHVARTRVAKKPNPDRRRQSSPARTGFMERLEERWRRRQEGDRRF